MPTQMSGELSGASPQRCSAIPNASPFVWVVVWGMTTPARGIFGNAKRKLHINEKKIGAALLSIDGFADFAKGLQIKLVTDSQVAMHCLRNISSKSPQAMRALRLLNQRCTEFNLNTSLHPLLPEYLGIQAVTTTRTSHMLTFPSLLPRLGHQLKYTVHHFADTFNSVRCFITVSDKPHPLALDWKEEILLLKTPLNVIPIAFDRVIRENLRASLVVPAWSDQAWYQRIAARSQSRLLEKADTLVVLVSPNGKFAVHVFSSNLEESRSQRGSDDTKHSSRCASGAFLPKDAE